MLRIIATDDIVNLKIVMHYIQRMDKIDILEYQIHSNELNPVIARFKTKEEARNFIENYSGELPELLKKED